MDVAHRFAQLACVKLLKGDDSGNTRQGKLSKYINMYMKLFCLANILERCFLFLQILCSFFLFLQNCDV